MEGRRAKAVKSIYRLEVIPRERIDDVLLALNCVYRVFLVRVKGKYLSLHRTYDGHKVFGSSLTEQAVGHSHHVHYHLEGIVHGLQLIDAHIPNSSTIEVFLQGLEPFLHCFAMCILDVVIT